MVQCQNCHTTITYQESICARCKESFDKTLLGVTLDDRWKITGFLGQGAMGQVYRAEHLLLSRSVAVKLLHASVAQNQEMLARFRREALVTSRLAHPHVVTTLDFGLHNKRPYFVMELVEGTPLDQLLRAGGPFSLTRALPLMKQIAHALGSAHQAKIVHRDVKPGNIMVASPGFGEYAKIMDFGIALNSETGLDSLTTTGLTVGTPNYMSPEQIAGERVDARADVYSLGATLYEIVTGQPPFPFQELTQVLKAHLAQTPPRPSQLRPGISPALETLIMTMLSKKPFERPANGLVVSETLQNLIETPNIKEPSPFLSILSMGMSPDASKASLQIAWFLEEIAKESGEFGHLVGQEAIGLFTMPEASFRLASRAIASPLGKEARFALHWGPVQIDSGIASGYGVRLSLALARVCRPGELLLTKSIKHELGFGFKSFLTQRGMLQVRSKEKPHPIFSVRKTKRARQNNSNTSVIAVLEKEKLSWICLCGSKCSVTPPQKGKNYQNKNLRVRCSACSRLLSLEITTQTKVKTIDPFEKDPTTLVASQVLQDKTDPEGERIVDKLLVDALAELK